MKRLPNDEFLTLDSNVQEIVRNHLLTDDNIEVRLATLVSLLTLCYKELQELVGEPRATTVFKTFLEVAENWR